MVLYGALTKIGPFRNSEEQTCHKESQSLLVRLLTLRWQGINGFCAKISNFRHLSHHATTKAQLALLTTKTNSRVWESTMGRVSSNHRCEMRTWTI